MRRIITLCIAAFIALGVTGCDWVMGDIPGGEDLPQLGTELFFDDFEGGVSSQLGFTSGDWECVDGELHPTTEPAIAHIQGGTGWTDYEVRVNMHFKDPDFFYGPPRRGVIVRASGDVDKVVFFGSDYHLWFDVYNGGKLARQWVARINQRLPLQCEVVVRVIENHYSAYVDGVLVIEMMESSCPTGGAGLWVLDSIPNKVEEMWFDNLRVTAIQ